MNQCNSWLFLCLQVSERGWVGARRATFTGNHPPFAEKALRSGNHVRILIGMSTNHTESWTSKERLHSINPVVLAGAALIQLGWFAVSGDFAGFNLANLWHDWLLRLIIGG
jgi:hypothetical protein